MVVCMVGVNVINAEGMNHMHMQSGQNGVKMTARTHENISLHKTCGSFQILL